MAKQIADKDNPLLESCSNLFSLAVPLATGDRGISLGDGYREKILSAFSELEREGFEKQLDPAAVTEARYALAAYIDEKVLSSSWPGKMDWMGRPLQLEFFGEHLAGEGFFDHLKKLRQGGERHLQVLEVFYVCLQMGFEGMYRMRGLEQLMALQVDLRAQMNDYRGRPTSEISPRGVPDISVFETVRREVPYWVIGIATVAVMFFGYIGFAYTLDQRAAGARAHLVAKHQEIVAAAPKINAQRLRRNLLNNSAADDVNTSGSRQKGEGAPAVGPGASI